MYLKHKTYTQVMFVRPHPKNHSAEDSDSDDVPDPLIQELTAGTWRGQIMQKRTDKGVIGNLQPFKKDGQYVCILTVCVFVCVCVCVCVCMHACIMCVFACEEISCKKEQIKE